MKNAFWWIAGGVIAYAVYTASQVSNVAKQLAFTIYGVKYASGDALNSILNVTIRVYNPTFTGVSFDSFQGSLFISGKKLADTFYKPGSGITLKPVTDNKGETLVTIPVKISHLSVLLTFPSLISDWTNGKFSQLINIVGSVGAGGVNIPINSNIGISGVSGIGRINGVGNSFTKSLHIPTYG